MLFFMRYQEKEYRVRVESRHGQTFVSFNDEPEQAVDLVYFGNDCFFIKDGRVFSANVTGHKTNYTVWLPEGNLEFTLESEYRRIVGIMRGQELGNENNVYAKMPGKIVKVLSKKGDKVEKGASVMVMEAMKMENEIRAPLSGTVTNVCVKEGQAVETGTLLMELQPLEV
jgi:acetyl/propionyl-CoA carboxylase alpha subunit